MTDMGALKTDVNAPSGIMKRPVVQETIKSQDWLTNSACFQRRPHVSDALDACRTLI